MIPPSSSRRPTSGARFMCSATKPFDGSVSGPGEVAALVAAVTVASGPMVTHSKGSSEAGDEPETAQQTYHRMLRDWMAPALRQMGFKGSGQRFSRPDDTYECRFWFQKSRWSTPQMVSFSARFDVLHRPTFEAFRETLREADTEHGVRLVRPAGIYGLSLETLIRDRDHPRDNRTLRRTQRRTPLVADARRVTHLPQVWLVGVAGGWTNRAAGTHGHRGDQGTRLARHPTRTGATS